MRLIGAEMFDCGASFVVWIGKRYWRFRNPFSRTLTQEEWRAYKSNRT